MLLSAPNVVWPIASSAQFMGIASFSLCTSVLSHSRREQRPELGLILIPIPVLISVPTLASALDGILMIPFSLHKWPLKTQSESHLVLITYSSRANGPWKAVSPLYVRVKFSCFLSTQHLIEMSHTNKQNKINSSVGVKKKI